MAMNRTARDYQPEDLQELRLTAVRLAGGFVVCDLSDGNVLRVPLAIAPALTRSRPNDIYQWQIVDEGTGIAWALESVREVVALRSMIQDPRAEILPSVQ